jgi:uncharacterized membrane protein YbhN (UPF0104 family)
MPGPAADTHVNDRPGRRCYPGPGRTTGSPNLSLDPTHAPAAGFRRLLTRRFALTGIAVAVVIALAAVGLASIDRGAVAGALAGADPRFLAIAIGAYALGQTISGVMWARCQRAGGVAGIRLGSAMGLHWISRGACELLPASLGEGVRVGLVRRHPGGRDAGMCRITGGLAAYKALDAVVTACVVLAIAFATPLPGPAGGLRWTALGFVVGVIAIALCWRLLGIGRLGRHLPRRVRELGQTLAGGAAALRDPREAGTAALLALGAALARIVSLGALLAAFGISPAAAGLAFCVIVLAGAVPGAPGGAGARELILVPALALAHGVSSGDAIAFSLGVQAIALGTSLMIGLAALALVGPRLRAGAEVDPAEWAPLAPLPPAALQRAPS